MQKVEYTPQAESDLDGMDDATYDLFDKHMDKIARMPPRRHLRFGIPIHVEEVGQGRILYQVKKDTIFILRCFQTHKEYEKWYKSLK